jgi:hypothetical protein
MSTLEETISTTIGKSDRKEIRNVPVKIGLQTAYRMLAGRGYFTFIPSEDPVLLITLNPVSQDYVDMAHAHVSNEAGDGYVIPPPAPPLPEPKRLERVMRFFRSHFQRQEKVKRVITDSKEIEARLKELLGRK